MSGADPPAAAPAVEPLTVRTPDGVALEAELAGAGGGPGTRGEVPRAGFVLCHPHPLYGGTMRSIVVSALFAALPRVGVPCLRFNFRGVEGSGGSHGGGEPERADARAAVTVLAARIGSGVPLVLAGWSFGGDVALSVRDGRIDAWLAVAPPLRLAADAEATGQDARPKVLVLAEHDEVRGPDSVRAQVAGWVRTEVEIVPGASHFFVGRTDRVVGAALRLVDRIAAPGGEREC